MRAPWVQYHWPWTSRQRGSALYEQIAGFMQATALDPTVDAAELTIYDDPDGSLRADGKQRFGVGKKDGREWRFERPVDLEPLLAFVREHELPRGKQPIDLALTYWFEVKRPGTEEPLYSDPSRFTSSVQMHTGLRSVNLVLRYATPDLTPDLRQANDEIIARIGIRSRGVWQRIRYSASDNEIRETLA